MKRFNIKFSDLERLRLLFMENNIDSSILKISKEKIDFFKKNNIKNIPIEKQYKYFLNFTNSDYVKFYNILDDLFIKIGINVDDNLTSDGFFLEDMLDKFNIL